MVAPLAMPTGPTPPPGPMSMQWTFARQANGLFDSPLDWPEVGTYLRERYIKNREEEARRERAAQRQRFYNCQGDSEMFEMFSKVYENEKVISLRQQFVEFAKYNNLTRRITNEIATVYSLPASRSVEGESNNANYQEVQRLSRQHEVMNRVNRMAFLHRAVAVGPRMRQAPSGDWLPVIDVVTPAKFFAVRDPLDPTQLVALIFENDFALAKSSHSGPSWTVWGWRETMMMDDAGLIVEKSIRSHGYPRIPWVLLTLEPPDGSLLDQTTGNDIVAAQKMIWFLQVLHAKESKSTTVQTIVQGDLSTAVYGQVNDTDTTGRLPEGTQIQTVNRAVDVSIFIKGAQHAAETTGSNYGIAPNVMRGESVTSADARELARLPLRELRLQQQIPFREFEREFAEVQSFVVAAKRPELKFTTDGWRVDFADPQTPLGTKEALEVFETKRRLSLTSTHAQMMVENQDLDWKQADTAIKRFVDDELRRNVLMRPLQQISGSPAADAPGGDVPGEPDKNADADEEDAAPMRATG